MALSQPVIVVVVPLSRSRRWKLENVSWFDLSPLNYRCLMRVILRTTATMIVNLLIKAC